METETIWLYIDGSSVDDREDHGPPWTVLAKSSGRHVGSNDVHRHPSDLEPAMQNYTFGY